MKLKKLIKDIPSFVVKGSKEIEITGICSDSRVAAPGNLFIAKQGLTRHGAQFIPEAIEGGATAVVTDIYDPMFHHVTQLIHPNPAAVEAHLTEVYHQYPSRSLYMVGVTGTNGKTTVSYLLKSLLDTLHGPCGLIGTIEYLIGDHSLPATRTTPEVTKNNKLLHEMVLRGCRSAVMEVTSHALDQGRVETIHYDAAIFTNLSQDHLDYHHTMEEYCNAKRRLFLSLNTPCDKKDKYPKVAIVNKDDPWAERIVDGCRAPLLTYGIDSDADVVAKNIVFKGCQTSFDLYQKGETIHCTSPLVGKFNVYNALAVAAFALANGMTLEAIAKAIAAFPQIPGRLDPVPNNLGLRIFVDFAHTDDALKNVLETIREMQPKRIITVFGCGGDRDKTKRAKMAKASGDFSDVTIVTSDNPRSEDPKAITDDVILGFSQGAKYEVHVDRREAIGRAIEMATPDDVVVIAGKGHETSQVFAHKTVEFDDKRVAEELCAHLINA